MIHIEPLQPHDWTAAMHLAHARVPAEQRPARVRHCLDLLENGVLDPNGIWIACEGQAVVGVQVCIALAGAACLFWLPTSNDGCSDALVHAGLQWSQAIGCKLAQALAIPSELALAEPLVRCGFRKVTRMRQLAHDLGEVPAEIASPLRYQSFGPALAQEFAATLERTYEGTLDCPELNGKRTIDEILAGHRAQGRFHADCWWLAYQDAAPVGIVMLVEQPDSASWELAYLGVVPEYRRRRLGRDMMLRAMHVVRDRPATRLVLALDERNAPAQRLYQALGFVEIECNEVLLYFW